MPICWFVKTSASNDPYYESYGVKLSADIEGPVYGLAMWSSLSACLVSNQLSVKKCIKNVFLCLTQKNENIRTLSW